MLLDLQKILVSQAISTYTYSGSEYGGDLKNLEPTSSPDDPVTDTGEDADQPTTGVDVDVERGGSDIELSHPPFPPPPTGDKKDPWYKQEWIWGIVGVVVTIVVSTACWKRCSEGSREQDRPQQVGDRKVTITNNVTGI